MRLIFILFMCHSTALFHLLEKETRPWSLGFIPHGFIQPITTHRVCVCKCNVYSYTTILQLFWGKFVLKCLETQLYMNHGTWISAVYQTSGASRNPAFTSTRIRTAWQHTGLFLIHKSFFIPVSCYSSCSLSLVLSCAATHRFHIPSDVPSGSKRNHVLIHKEQCMKKRSMLRLLIIF